MRRSILALVLGIAAMFALAPPAGAVGPGGWDHLGHGSTAAQPSLNGSVLALNSDAPGVLLVGGSFTSAGCQEQRHTRFLRREGGCLKRPPVDAVHALITAH
jgi:hypothetical protein